MEPSGKFVLRAGARLHEQLKDEARAAGVSLNQICLERLALKPEAAGFGRLFQDLPFRPLGLLRYGSAVRGEQTERSDIDWLLIVPHDRTIDRDLYDCLDQIELPSRKISIHLSHLPRDEDDFSNFWLELALEAELLWDPEGLVHRSLIQIRREIAAGRYQRHLTHGQPYWVRKNDAQSKTR